MMGVGMKVQTSGMKGELTKVFDLVDEGVRFVCEQDDPDSPFALLQVDYEYSILPPFWKMKLASRQGLQRMMKSWRKGN